MKNSLCLLVVLITLCGCAEKDYQQYVRYGEPILYENTWEHPVSFAWKKDVLWVMYERHYNLHSEPSYEFKAYKIQYPVYGFSIQSYEAGKSREESK